MKRNDEMIKKSNEKMMLNSKMVFWIICSSIISALTITFVYNIEINEYFKYIIFPFCTLLINYGIILWRTKYLQNKKAYIWLIPIIAIFISDILLPVDTSNLILNILILPVLISFFFLSMINKNYSVSRNFGKWIIKLFPLGLFTNLKHIIKIYDNNIKGKKKKVINILLGTCIGIPIAFIILNLLTSADKYFSVFIGSITKIFSNILNFDFILQNIFIFMFFLVIFYNVIINTFKHKDTKEKELSYYNVNYDISKTVLIIVNIVFILFLISEISKITVNFLSLPIEYTYAEYAREGFFQLLFVTAINFGIIMFYLYYTNNWVNNKILKRLLLTLIFFSILLIFNSYYRMFLYIGNYGFTILRLQVILFLLMELTLFIIMMKKIIYKLKHQDAKIFATIIISTYIINLYYCVQTFIDFLNSYFKI